MRTSPDRRLLDHRHRHASLLPLRLLQGETEAANMTELAFHLKYVWFRTFVGNGQMVHATISSKVGASKEGEKAPSYILFPAINHN